MSEEIQTTLEKAITATAFNPGGPHDWATLAEVFVEGAVMALRFFPDDPDITVTDVAGFIDHPRRDNPLRKGLEETDRTRAVEVVGDVAYVHERFTMSFAGHDPVGAIDAFTLARIDGAWRIVSFITDFEESHA